MAEKRSEDASPKAYFRSERMFMDSGEWYFYTREGTIEGPCPDMVAARIRLDSYIKVINSGLAPSDGKYSLAALEVV